MKYMAFLLRDSIKKGSYFQLLVAVMSSFKGKRLLFSTSCPWELREKTLDNSIHFGQRDVRKLAKSHSFVILAFFSVFLGSLMNVSAESIFSSGSPKKASMMFLITTLDLLASMSLEGI